MVVPPNPFARSRSPRRDQPDPPPRPSPSARKAPEVVKGEDVPGDEVGSSFGVVDVQESKEESDTRTPSSATSHTILRGTSSASRPWTPRPTASPDYPYRAKEE